MKLRRPAASEYGTQTFALLLLLLYWAEEAIANPGRKTLREL
jgi:hypothetical protein